jgi:molybdenum cofactor guanylyltransferase
LEVNGIVLAGGKSARFKRNKLFEVIGGQVLLERVVSRLGFLESKIFIVRTEGQAIPLLKEPNLTVLTDLIPGGGPLGGIYAGLAASETSRSLVVAGDMPFLNRPLLEYMLGVSADFDLVIPRIGVLVEPLHAVYSETCLEPIKRLLDGGELSVRSLFTELKVKYVELEEIDRFDKEHLSFFNINLNRDLERARELARSEN